MYINTKDAASSENYKLLETMNNVTRERYAEMSEMAQRLVKEMSKLQSTCMSFVKDTLFANMSIHLLILGHRRRFFRVYEANR